MRAIGRNLAILAAASAALSFAAVDAAILDLFASMTSALSNENTAGFMAAFDKNMPEYDRLRTYIDGLIGEGEITSNIDPVKDQGDASRRSVDLDWTMRIRSRELSGPMVEREQTIHAELVKQKKHWRIVSITPLDFFAPAKFSPSK